MYRALDLHNAGTTEFVVVNDSIFCSFGKVSIDRKSLKAVVPEVFTTVITDTYHRRTGDRPQLERFVLENNVRAAACGVATHPSYH
jgi:hypothetical protein